MSESILEINDGNFQSEILESDKPALVDFWAPWCGPCRMVGPVVEELAGEFADQLKVGKLNVDDSPKTAAEYGIRSIPTLLIFKDGKVADQTVGAAKKEQLKAFVEKNL